MKDGEDNKCTEFYWGKPLGKWLLARLRRRWEHNIKMNLRKMVVMLIEQGEYYVQRWALLLALLNAWFYYERVSYSAWR
jgi:hypothetical protein